MRTIYVTGADGALGRALVRHLSALGPVVPVTRTTAPMPGALWYDPTQADAAIVHAAGRSGAIPADRVGPETRLHLDLFRNLRDRGWQGRLALLSSAAVYGDAAVLPTPETAPLRPVNAYGLHKLGVEQGLADIVSDRVILRLSNVYGTALDLSRRRVIALLVAAAQSGRTFTTFGPGTSLRDYLHVDDLSRAVVAALAGPPGVYNIGGGEGISLNALIGRVEAVVGRPLSCENGETRPEPKSSTLETALARRQLGWSPVVPLDEGIRRLCAQMRGD